MRRVNDESGFSLIEVLMSMVLLAIVATGLAPAMLMNFKTLTRNELRTEAMAASQVVLDDLRTEDPALLPGVGDTDSFDITVNDRGFVVEVDYCVQSTICDENRSRHLELDVLYKGELIYEVETVFTQLR